MASIRTRLGQGHQPAAHARVFGLRMPMATPAVELWPLSPEARDQPLGISEVHLLQHVPGQANGVHLPALVR